MNVELRYVIILRACLQGSYEHCDVATNFFTTFTDCSTLTLNFADDISSTGALFITSVWTTMIVDI